MNLLIFVQMVVEMRSAQRRYFVEQSRSHLAAAQLKDKQVDQAIHKLLQDQAAFRQTQRSDSKGEIHEPTDP